MVRTTAPRTKSVAAAVDEEAERASRIPRGEDGRLMHDLAHAEDRDTTNHTTITGPKIADVRLERRCTRNNATRMTTVSGTTTMLMRGAAIASPSTALSTEIAGVTTPSP